MPRGNRTGPAGMGPMTGRGLGGCSGGEQAMAGYDVRGFGHGAGRAGRFRGGGRSHCFRGGQGRMFAPPHPTDMTAKQETAALEEQAVFLERQTDAVKRRIDELKANQGKTDSEEKT